MTITIIILVIVLLLIVLILNALFCTYKRETVVR